VYKLEVPRLLVLLKEAIVAQGGFEAEGLFRLGGEELKMQKVKKDLNRGQFDEHDCDVFGMAALIKAPPATDSGDSFSCR
jgi:hypothetical protein